MSILIKGVKLPKDDAIKVVIRGDDGIASVYIEDGKSDYYKVVELPDHGDLIDRDALMARYAEEVKPSNNSDFMRPPRWNDAVQLTELAPVVIPAEGRAENEKEELG